MNSASTPSTVRELADTVSVTHRLHKPELVFLNTSDILSGRVLHRNYTTVSGWPGQAKKSIKRGDILFSEIRPANGRYAFVDFDADDYVVSTKLMVIRAKPGRIAPRFLYHFLTSSRTTEWLQHLAESRSGTFPQITFDQVADLELVVPSPIQQEMIAGLFDAIDEEIEHNRRTAQAIERLSRAIFRAWFVDFDPVKAKAAGATAFPSMPQAVFDALPTRFIDSEIDLVPEGWGVGTLDDVVGERKERINPSGETLRLPYVPIECITAKRVTLEDSKDGSEAKSSLIRFVAGDILFGAMRPYFHKVCLAPYDGTTRTTCFVLDPRTEMDRAFSLMLASEASTVEYATNHSVGSTIPYAKWENSLAAMPCIIPPVTCRAAFADLVDGQLRLCQQLVRESRELMEMRDYLLPKLLSSAVRVDVQNMELLA